MIARLGLAGVLALLLLGLMSLPHVSRAQFNGCKAGFCSPVAVAAGYSGPGDVVSGALAWWGFRCYNAAYSGNVADIWDSSTGSTTETLLTCSAGGTVNQTINSLATTCAVACSVKQMYDQSGAASCSSAACNLSQATNSRRPALTTSCQNSKPCLVCAGSLIFVSDPVALTQAQPFTISAVGERTGAFSSFGDIYSNDSGGTQVGFSNSANNALEYAGTVQSATAADSAWHSLQFVINGASSLIYVEGTSTSASPGAATLASGGHGICADNNNGGNPATGNVTEVGIWGAFSPSQASAMTANQRAYWGF